MKKRLLALLLVFLFLGASIPAMAAAGDITSTISYTYAPAPPRVVKEGTVFAFNAWVHSIVNVTFHSISVSTSNPEVIAISTEESATSTRIVCTAVGTGSATVSMSFSFTNPAGLKNPTLSATIKVVPEEDEAPKGDKADKWDDFMAGYNDKRKERTEGTDVSAVTAEKQKPLFEYGGTDVAGVTADGEKPAFEYGGTDVAAVTACPVDVKILDAEGTLLATVKNHDTELVEIDGLIAGAVDEMKILRIPQDKVEAFRIQLEATDDGVMTFATGRVNKDLGFDASAGFISVPLKKGQLYEAEILYGAISQLFLVEDGERVSEIQPDIIVYSDALAGELPSTNMSAWAAEAITAAITNDVATDDLLKDFQANTTRAEFCRAAVHFIEKYADKPIADILEERSLAAKTFVDTDDEAIAAAAALGVTSGTDAEKNLFSPDAPLTREQAAVMLMNTLKALEIDVSGDAAAEWTDGDSISSWAVEAASVVYARSVMGGTSAESLLFSPKLSYTHEQSILTFNNLWKHLKD